MNLASANDRLAMFGPPASLRGVVRYKGDLAQQGYRLTRFLVDISHRDNRQPFLDDEEGAMTRAALSPQECALLRARDYAGMLAYGVNVYALAKAGYVFGNSLLEIGRSMRKPQDTTEGAH